VAWFHRKQHRIILPPERPPLPDPPAREEVERTTGELRKAKRQLAETEAREDAVTDRSDYLDHVHKVNRIGPKFFDALGIQRKKA
jgi:hypothetical protein